MGELTEAAIKKLKVNELKAELSKRGLLVKGKKDDLVKRLVEAINNDSDEESDKEETDEDSAPEDAPTEEEGTVEITPQVAEETLEKVEAPSSPVIEAPVPAETPALVEVPASVEDPVPVPMDTETAADEPKVSDCSGTDEPRESIGKDYVIVSKPSKDVAEEVEKAAKAQDAAVVEEVVEGTGEVTKGTAETPMETEPAKVEKSPKKSSKEERVSSSGKSTEDVVMKDATEESQRKSKSEKESKDKTDSTKVDKEEVKTEEVKKKEPAIPDVMAVVEPEEGEEPEEFEIPEGHVALDSYLSDIHFIISHNGLSGQSLVKNGFSYMWAGARANKGAKGGKVGYELKVTKLCEVDLPPSEAPINAVRIGWSSEYSNLQLGESSLSYGFESTGKVCASSSFFDYGQKFTEGDVIGTYLDLESEPKTLRYTKNGEDLGVAMSLTVNLEEKPLFPHVFLRNMKVELNFGGSEEPWFPTLEGYTLIQNAGAENIADKTCEPATEFSDCQMYLMVGLPSAGKTYWAKKYADSHPKDRFNLIGTKYVMERCKLEGKYRKKSDSGTEKLMKAVITILTKLYQLCPKRKRNYIFDQNNVYKIAQELKMAPFADFKRKAVVIIPSHDNLRRRTSDSKRRGDIINEVPFGDLCDMKCEFHIPEVGDIFDEVQYPENDEKSAEKIIRDYKSDGSRAKRTGRDEYYPGGKRKRYDDRPSNYSGGRRDNRFVGGSSYGRDSRKDDGWKNSGSGYGSYGGNKGRSDYGGSSGGYKRPDNRSYNAPYKQNVSSGGSGGGYRTQSYGGSTGGNYRGNTGSSYGSNNYGGSYGGGSYGTYNQSSNRGSSGGHWGGQYNQSSQQQQYGSGTWGGYNRGGGSYGSGGGYSY